jgi:haloacetate dehalogenase
MWHRVAPLLARDFTVVAPDLRGYGGSSKPATTPDHVPYSKRAMARDMVALMGQLGFERFAVAGHDRGGRVGYRLALDQPERLSKLAVLDIIPTGEAFRRADRAFGLGYWHWFFLAQPAPLPEALLSTNPDAYYFRDRQAPWLAPASLDDYLRCTRDPQTIHAMCEDYRAGATIDYELDEADRGVRRITCPVLALWGRRGRLEEWYDVLAICKSGRTTCKATRSTAATICSKKRQRRPTLFFMPSSVPNRRQCRRATASLLLRRIRSFRSQGPDKTCIDVLLALE